MDFVNRPRVLFSLCVFLWAPSQVCECVWKAVIDIQHLCWLESCGHRQRDKDSGGNPGSDSSRFVPRVRVLGSLSLGGGVSTCLAVT